MRRRIIKENVLGKHELEAVLNLQNQKGRKDKREIMIIKKEIFSSSPMEGFPLVSPFRATSSSLDIYNSSFTF